MTSETRQKGTVEEWRRRRRSSRRDTEAALLRNRPLGAETFKSRRERGEGEDVKGAAVAAAGVDHFRRLWIIGGYWPVKRCEKGGLMRDLEREFFRVVLVLF